MPRIKLTIEYDGRGFVGWQRQDNGLAVQEVLETAITGYCGHMCPTFASGRTDAGVHALGQVAHFDLPRTDPPETIRAALNYHLKPHAVSILTAEIVPEDFHARFSCLGRAYLYRIVNRPAPLALESGRAWWVPKPLNAEAMHEAAQVLVGRHDFTSFRAVACQSKSPVKTLDSLDVRRVGEVIEIRTDARSFLHHQVRNMVGTLKRVGEGKWTAHDVRTALAACDRSAAGATAPSVGLYFLNAHYEV
ncbi:MAG: tRNA pseudouridine(38-40) synthase TruA [Rhodospirillaceae bacterium]|nr:tRNA pseudouridine(38-40) synthase TruA [Rhodospirillaceae bacterium]